MSNVTVPLADREPRGARRKRDTRARLMKAAFNLMADKGIDGVAINEITEAADVGFGTFYNHFSSKEAIHTAVMAEVIGHFAHELNRLGEQLQDPAEKISASLRYTLLRARQDPLWGQFVVRTGFSPDGVSQGLGQYLLQDLSAGVAMKRLTATDLPMTFVAVGSTILGAMAAELQVERARTEAQPLIAVLGPSEDIPERVATILLTWLGLTPKEAHEIARRPLPVIALPPNPLQ